MIIYRQSEGWDTELKKNVRSSLSVKIFLLTCLLLCLISGITYLCIARMMPAVYTNQLEEKLGQAAEDLKKELERHDSVENAASVLDYFEADHQASVIILDEEGNEVYPARETAVYEESVSEDFVSDMDMAGVGISDEQAAEEAHDSSAASAEQVQNAAEEVHDVSAASAEQMQVTAEASDIYTVEGAGTKSYSIKVGDAAYTMLVRGTLQQVSQAVEVLKSILPYIIAVIAAASFICALGAAFYLAAPIRRISSISQDMAELRFDRKCSEKRRDEVGILARNLNALSEKLSVTLKNLQEANRQLKSDMEKEREQEQKRTAFFAAVSHELKTPVTILKGHIGGMLKRVDGYQDRDYYLERSYEVTDSMEGMVQEILTISRMDAQEGITKKEKLDLSEIIRRQFAQMVELMEQKGLDWNVEIPEHIYCMADESMMNKVFRNLIMNAVRYSPEGERITVRARENEGEIFCGVENTGIHIPEEALPRLFDAFYRVDDSRNRSMGGSGLGLYIVKMALEYHQAQFGACNTDQGVSFYFSMKNT